MGKKKSDKSITPYFSVDESKIRNLKKLYNTRHTHNRIEINNSEKSRH